MFRMNFGFLFHLFTFVEMKSVRNHHMTDGPVAPRPGLPVGRAAGSRSPRDPEAPQIAGPAAAGR